MKQVKIGAYLYLLLAGEPRVFVYPHLVLNYDLAMFSAHSIQNLKTKNISGVLPSMIGHANEQRLLLYIHIDMLRTLHHLL